jgi:hypothetical protein
VSPSSDAEHIWYGMLVYAISYLRSDPSPSLIPTLVRVDRRASATSLAVADGAAECLWLPRAATRPTPAAAAGSARGLCGSSASDDTSRAAQW